MEKNLVSYGVTSERRGGINNHWFVNLLKIILCKLFRKSLKIFFRYILSVENQYFINKNVYWIFEMCHKHAVEYISYCEPVWVQSVSLCTIT